MRLFIRGKNNRGATLVEALIAVYILSMGILPSLAAVILANSFSSLIKNNLVAANVAQEGVEVVKAIRDENWFNNRSFDNGLADGDYRVEWNSTSLMAISTNPVLKVSTLGIYNYSTGTDTNFRRKITVAKIDPTGCNCELRILVEVTWLERNKTRTVRVESHLYNWK